MLVAQNSLGPVCPVPLTVRGKSSIQNKYERDADLTTWVRADGCSRWLRTARMSWLVLAAQKVAPSVQTIEDAKRDKLVQADIERQ